MIDAKAIDKLAKLSRLGLTKEEKENFASEIASILAYVDEIKKVSLKETDYLDDESGLINVLRDDTESHQRGEYTDLILDEAPEVADRYIKVKKIL